MQIGIDCRLPFYRLGGISQYVIHLVAALSQQDSGNQYTIFRNRRDHRSYRRPGAANFRQSSLWTPCHHRLERWSISIELLAQRLDVFHSPDFIPPAFVRARRVITVHDLNFVFYPEYLTRESRRFYLGQIDWAVKNADHILADSYHTRTDLEEQLGVEPERVSVVHLAANPVYNESPDAGRVNRTLSRHGLPRGFILFVGTLEPRKNLATLLSAYKQMRLASDIDVPLVLVGSWGWMQPGMESIARELEAEPQIRHLEGVGDEELSHLYRAAGLLAMPSHYEGFGLPALEAMHCNCPVVTSNRASLPEVVGDAGIQLEAEDSAAWADTFIRVLSDSSLRRQMTNRGQKQAGMFTWQKAASHTLAVYKMVGGSG